MGNRTVGIGGWRAAAGEEESRTVLEPQWYACYTRARHEKRVARVLHDRGVERYLPVVGQRRQWHDRTRTVEFPLFPGYVFVRTVRTQLFDVTCVPSVVTMVMSNGKPAAISEDEIENIRRFAAALTRTGEAPEAQPLLETGERVVITAGPFAGIEAVVEELRGASRVVIGVAALGQGFALNIPLDKLRRVGHL